MNCIVFLGPTLSQPDASPLLEAAYRPPAVQGDVYQAVRQNPKVIAIIDGCFEATRSVWHKEVLWAMSKGVHVLGAASLGALRAAELESFGMEGIGNVFHMYRDGVLEDDDEVAVLHGPAELGFRSLTTAMVDIRATLLSASYSSIISQNDAAAFMAIAKNMFYKERSYARLLSEAAKNGIGSDTIRRLRMWLPRGQVHAKREDAVELLRTIAQRLQSGIDPKQVSYSFEVTDCWVRLRRSIEFGGSDSSPQPSSRS